MSRTEGKKRVPNCVMDDAIGHGHASDIYPTTIMLPHERPSIRRRTPHSTLSFSPELLTRTCDTCLTHDTCSFLSLASRVVRPARHGHPSSRPIACVRCLCSPYLLLSISRPLTAERLPASSPTPNTTGMPRRGRPYRWLLGARARGASGRPWPSQGSPRARPDASGSRAPQAPTLTAGIG
jgi:hypothetical protein